MDGVAEILEKWQSMDGAFYVKTDGATYGTPVQVLMARKLAYFVLRKVANNVQDVRKNVLDLVPHSHEAIT